MPGRALLSLLSAVAVAAAALSAAPRQSAKAALLNPANLTDTAPESFNALFDTTAGTFVVHVQRLWAPYGADRFYNLVKHGFYDNCRFFRVVPKFMAQFGIHGDPEVAAAWSQAFLPADRARLSNTRGRMTFAMGSTPFTRTTQVFINFGDNSKLDIDGFAPFGEVVSSMVLVERIYSGYGEGADQNRIQLEGNAFLAKALPRLDYIRKATIE